MRTTAAVLAWLAAALVFLPPGASGLAALLWLGAASLGVLGVPSVLRARGASWLLRREGLHWLLAWSLWMAASAAWTVAPQHEWPRHASHVVMLLTVPVMAASVTPAVARRGLKLFVAGAAGLALLWAWHARWPWPAGKLLSTLVHYAGNKSIANGLLVALAAALALHFGWRAAAWQRAGWWLLAAALALMVLTHSASRTAHAVLMLLPLVLLVWHVHTRGGRWVMAAGVALAAGAGWLWFAPGSGGLGSSSGGSGGLAARGEAGQLQQSDSSRRALYLGTLKMIEARPLIGHGLGAWTTLWQHETYRSEGPGRPDGPPALRGFNTAHSAPLQLAAEGGLIGVTLLLGAVAGWAAAARRASLVGDGAPLALVLIAFSAASLVNATLRDAVFSSPMVVLLALALALAVPPAATATAGTPPPPH